ncbi:leucyl/phenylalanyl-tRNA--protein transferase [Paracoccaceae bacterium]|nr:leucyl/phenylalanyl-tRNA--protein transferase [Paracoccaceae bacterium]
MHTRSYTTLNPETVIKLYKNGIFPMGDQDNDNRVFWCNPLVRAIIPISKLHISQSLKRLCKKKTFEFSINYDFPTIIANCANRDETWINRSIISSYKKLHDLGYAHSIEVWEDKKIKGGLYGVAIGKAFFAESMFSTSPNGSKLALIVLMGILELNKFQLLDVQFMTNHLKTMGAKEISRNVFLYLLQKSTCQKAQFVNPGTNIIDKNLIFNAEKSN